MTDRRSAALAFYGPLADSPDAARRVGWDNASAHAIRLAAIADVVLAYAPSTVLDAGCGEGALLPVLRGAGFVGAYRGEDVLDAMIDRARATHRDPQASFACVDAFAASADPRADAVTCSGALNTLVGADHDAEVAAALTALWARAGLVLAVDLAVVDRHADGVGIGRADLEKAWRHARSLAPIVVVREDVIPGEALLIMSRSRAPSFARWMPDVLARARALLDAHEPEVALALLADDLRPEAWLVRGRAWVMLAASQPTALASAREALERAAGSADPAVADGARLELAPLAWRRGDKAGAEAQLRALITSPAVADDARAHLTMLLLARRAHEDALAIAKGIGDPWIRREIEARVAVVAGAALGKSIRSS